MLALYVALGGALGSLARYAMMSEIGKVWRGNFPVGTFAVNVAGSFVMGVLIGWLARALPPMQQEIRLFIGVGMLGGFTTFSAFSLDAATLIEQHQWPVAIAYAILSVTVSILGLFAGLWLMRVGSL